MDICNDHGLEFIGPKPNAIRVMGDKSTARDTMKAAGVPTVPGSDGLVTSADEAVEVAGKIGFPIMIKATAGGGGRGMRLAQVRRRHQLNLCCRCRRAVCPALKQKQIWRMLVQLCVRCCQTAAHAVRG